MQNRKKKKTQIYRTVFWTLWEKARVGCFERTASKHVYYLGWNRSPAQVGCMRQVLGPGALGRPRGIGWRGRWEWGSGWGTHVNPWLIHFTFSAYPLFKQQMFYPEPFPLIMHANAIDKVKFVLNKAGTITIY